MVDGSLPAPMPGIAALSPTTARRLGSGQVLVDASSLVKELIENALDARAKSIFVDINANTIDSIQVKDDGHGIPAEDRALVCRRYCTSKIRDFHDLKEVGGKWLGFRGEALSSIAEMSGNLSITTRVEGEPVAVKLKFARDGELLATERDSHPVGTTVKITRFFEHIPVRKQTSVNNAVRCLARIRRLMQAYALARPAVRFRLHILKAKKSKGDFSYAPKANSNVEDAVFKVIGKDCALQCDWTALESDGFEIHAFLPKATANEQKIANHGAFISIDSRPVSNSRGTIKQIVAALKERLRKSNSSFTGVKDPFFCMNIICPPASYDPNIEPAKDDVMFEDSKIVLDVVDKLLQSYYPEATVEVVMEPPTSAQLEVESDVEDVLSETQNRNLLHVISSIENCRQPEPEPRQTEPKWRSSMYGIDEDDLEHLQDDQRLTFEEDEGRHAADVSNPWTIARMNAPIKSKASVAYNQLLSPAKSCCEMSIEPSSPSVAVTPFQHTRAEPLSPRTPSGLNGSASLLYKEVEKGTCRPSHDISEQSSIATERMDSNQSIDCLTTKQLRGSQLSVKVPSALRERQPMRGSQPVGPSPRRKRRKGHGPPFCAYDTASSPPTPTLSAAEQAMETRMYSENNTDIRNFFRTDEHHRACQSYQTPQRPSFTPINPPFVASPTSEHLDGPFLPLGMRERPSSQPVSSRTGSYSSRDTWDMLKIHAEDNTDSRSCNPNQNFEVYKDAPIQLLMPRSSSVSSERSRVVPMRASPVRTALHQLGTGTDKLTQQSRDIATYFKAYQDRENTSLIRSVQPTRRQQPRAVPSHELTNTSRPQRHQTTDGTWRSKSSNLPLERVPHGHEIQDMILPFRLSVASILQMSHKLDMSRNSPGFNHVIKNASDAFAEPVSDLTIMRWVIQLDGSLHKAFDKFPHIDMRSLLHKRIHRNLHHAQTSSHNDHITTSLSHPPNIILSKNTTSIPKNYTSSHDIQHQLLDFDAGLIERPADSVYGNKTDEDFGDDIDDDMLLDL